RIRLDLEEQDAVGPSDLPVHGVELALRIAGPRGDGEPRALEHLLGLAPVEEAAELIGADDEDWIVEALGPEQLDGARIWVEPNAVAGECGARQCQSIPDRGVNFSMRGALAHEYDEAVHSEVLPRRVGNRDMAEVRRIEGTSVEDCHSHSSTSSPTSTSSP